MTPVSAGKTVVIGQIGITVLDNFISDAQVNDLLNLYADKVMEDSTVCTKDGVGEKIDSRTGLRRWVSHNETPELYGLCIKIADFVGKNLDNAENVQLLSYSKGQKYEPHFDAFDKSKSDWTHYGKGGQRVYTVMGYLNDLYDGGETSFPTLGIDIKPRRGRLLVWSNVGEDYSVPHPDSLHGGMPVGEGEKKCFTIWFRENNYK